MKIASWNVNSLRVRLPHVLTWLSTHAPDVLALQETKVENDKFPHAELEAAGYYVAYSGQKTYNGVALLTREPFTSSLLYDFPDLSDPQRRMIGTHYGSIYVLNIYVPNGEDLLSEKFIYKMQWLTVLESLIKTLLTHYQHVLILGDFNIAPAAIDVYDAKVWHEQQILCSTTERDALQRLYALGLVDCFRHKAGDAVQFSWWDYRAARFRRNQGLRIDLILASSALATKCVACDIDTTPRAWEKPSDHAPVWADFSIF
jgi:exodeoxyribonuclease III